MLPYADIRKAYQKVVACSRSIVYLLKIYSGVIKLQITELKLSKFQTF